VQNEPYKDFLMQIDVSSQIAIVEERLRLAMLASDVGVLEELISPGLIFTNHLGQVLGQQDDVALHRSGMLRFSRMDPSETQLKTYADLCIISVRMKVAGTYGGTPFGADLRYTRVWRQDATGRWQIVAGHSSVVQE
jgi:ketosteroid isomerase-like protein